MKTTSSKATPDLTRRFLIASTAGLFVPRWAWAESSGRPILNWQLEDTGDAALESMTKTEDPVASRTGHAHWVGQGVNRALRLDGYSVWVTHSQSQTSFSGTSITLAAWLALESYPVYEAAIIDLGSDGGARLRMSIDRLGFVQAASKLEHASTVCKSAKPVRTAKWVHVAAVYDRLGVTLFVDGAECAHAGSSATSIEFTSKVTVTLGRSPDCPLVADTFATGALNGLLRDVRIYDAGLSATAVATLARESAPNGMPDLEMNGPWCEGDPHRPLFHALPPRAWTNEPHGLVQFGGKFHLFYQKNPNGPYWGHIHWGHMSSPDLYHWTEMPVALAPEPGPDQEGCWSGSVMQHDGKLAILYTGGDGHRSAICLAESADGMHFTKHPGNPVIPAPPAGMNPEFRDPFVWQEGDWYFLIVGSAVKDTGGTALLYRSRDLVRWEFRKQLLVGDRETSGVFWEMPIFVPIGDLHALIVCEVPGRASYWVGSWKDETFTPISASPRRLELFNHMLSPTRYIDAEGQVVTMGIIPDERGAKECWNAGWAHLYSLPRLLSADAAGHIWQRPHPSIEQWQGTAAIVPAFDLVPGEVHLLDAPAATCVRLQVTFKRGDSDTVSVLIRRSPDEREQTAIRYEWEIGRLIFDRTRSSLDPAVRRDVQQETYFPGTDGEIHFDVFLDRSVLEVFVDERAAFGARIYPTLQESTGLALEAAGTGARAEAVSLARISLS